MRAFHKTMTLALALAAGAIPPQVLAADGLSEAVAADYDAKLEALFLDFHRNPELSHKELRTAGIIARELRAVGVDVTEGVGGTGVVGVMRNGAGPTVLVRADMDGLPIEEASGLAYASKARQVDVEGIEQPVMHACGHDVHITSLIGTARRLSELKDRWSGTVVFIAQPAEERVNGASAMLEDGLYERFPKPDYALAFHVGAPLATGRIEIQPGITASTSDSVNITIHGVGTHGAYPHAGKDPIVIGAEIVMALQTIVSREISPLQPAVVTVGAFHAGAKHNIISDRAELQLTVRSNDNEVRDKLIAAIERIAKGVGRMNGLPDDMLPEIEIVQSTPVTINDKTVTERIEKAFTTHFGADTIVTDSPQTGMGAEDFGVLVTPNTDVPGVYFNVGGTPKAELDALEKAGKPEPAHHSPFFKIAPEPAVTLGTEAMTVAVFDLLAPDAGAAAD
ncbi:peptidase M20 [Novosphingobium sp. PC22D]|uniref:amidohydrolase n=1 Tax=Novosphingobium sp. PC22D TaxID=1962403 RepID=UPI000BF1EB89|nr:amidohydrolase [Novosphingobium sp. PC22D]PEQ10776.1 peptidase M20 [Novosphingobium sp. PC22D]